MITEPLYQLPHDRSAEAALLACFLMSPQKLQELKGRVKVQDFFILPHRHIYTACLALAEAGQPADLITVHDEIKRRDLDAEAPLDLLQDISLAVDSAANAAHYAGIVIRQAELRMYARLGQQISTAAQEPLADPDDLSARILMAYEARTSRQAATLGLPWQLPCDILAPVPPVPWLVPGLHLAPGRPCIVAGYGASAKTLACQALAIAAAAGRPVWGEFDLPRALTVRHVDCEQGEGATRRRYKRLSFAGGITEHDLADRLQMVSFPGLYLSQKGSEAAWKRVADGADLVILDSLRAMTPGVDENSSEMRKYLDPLTRISEATGACFIVIHHAGKSPSDPKAGKRESRQQLRGSSGIFDAAGSVFLLTGAGAEAKKVEQAKAPADAEGGSIAQFWLTVDDVSDGANDRAGVQVMYHATDPAADIMPETATEKVDRMKQQIISVIQERPGLSGHVLKQAVGGRGTVIMELIASMVENGEIKRMVRDGRGAGDAYYIV